MLAKYKSILITAVVAFVIGCLSGGWLMSKWAAVEESARLEKALEMREREKEAALAALKSYYENKPPVEVIKTEVEYVIKNVPYSPECDLDPREQRMLDYSRTGMRATAGGVEESAPGSETAGPVERVPRAAEVAAHADAGIKYQQCLAVAKAVLLYSENRVSQ